MPARRRYSYVNRMCVSAEFIKSFPSAFWDELMKAPDGAIDAEPESIRVRRPLFTVLGFTHDVVNLVVFGRAFKSHVPRGSRRSK